MSSYTGSIYDDSEESYYTDEYTGEYSSYLSSEEDEHNLIPSIDEHSPQKKEDVDQKPKDSKTDVNTANKQKKKKEAIQPDDESESSFTTDSASSDIGVDNPNHNSMIRSVNMNSPLMKNLKKLFKEIDSSGDGLISAPELAQVLRAFGKPNVSNDEVRKTIAEIDEDGNGELDFYEFVTMVRDIMPEMFERSQDPRAWKKYIMQEMKDAFKVFDKDGDGVISRDEMRFALSRLNKGTPIPDDEFSAIIHILDENSDGEIDFDEFTNALKDPNGMLFNHLEKALMPSPLEYLQSFMGVPDSFRPSVLFQKVREGTQLASRFMKPYLNESGLAYQDLVLDNSDSGVLLPCYLENCGTFKVSLLSANGIPSPNIRSTSFRSKKTILQYKAYVSLIDLSSKQFLSNVYTVNAKINKNREDGWKFSKKDPMNDMYVRSFYDMADLAIYIELVLEIATKKEKGSTVSEQCVGWTSLPLSKDMYRNTQAQRITPMPLQVKGGTIMDPLTINQADIRNRRKDFAGILRNVVYVGKPNPTLNVKISRVGKPKKQEFFSRCPPNLIFNGASVRVLELYRKMLANRLIQHRTLDDQHRQVNSIMLNQVPKMMDDPHIWMSFVSSWNSQKKSKNDIEKRFLQHIRDYFPVRYCFSVPKLKDVDEENHEAQRSHRKNFINQYGTASKKMTCQSDYTYQPFDMQSETLYDVF